MQPTQASNETKLPRAVLRRSQAIAERYAPKAEPDAPNPAADAAPATPPAAPPPATPAEPQAAAPAVDPRDTDPSYWRQRFSVTEGILRRERADRATEAETLHQRIAKLEDEARSFQAQTPTKIDITQFYTPEQIEKYGEEQCEVMAATAMRAARMSAQESITAAVQPLKDHQTRTRDREAASAQQQFQDKLTELYPNWPVADKDPSWLAWLAEDDENGAQRQSILTIHITNGNASGAARMFKAWEKTKTPVAAPPTPPVTPSGSGAAPGSDTPQAPAAPDGKAFTPPTGAEVKDYYKRSALGKVKDLERVAFEARLALRNAR
jgi:hypothetical protein